MPCGCWRGRRERVRPRARRPGAGLGERGNPHTGAPARCHGEAGASPTCCRVRSRRTTSSSSRATGRGGTGRRCPRHAADARGGRAHLGQVRTPLARLAGRPREEVGPVSAHGGGARPGAWVRYSPKGPSKRVGSREPVFEFASAPQQPQSSRSSVHPLSHPRYTAYAKPYFSYYGKF